MIEQAGIGQVHSQGTQPAAYGGRKNFLACYRDSGAGSDGVVPFSSVPADGFFVPFRFENELPAEEKGEPGIKGRIHDRHDDQSQEG